MNIYVYVIYSTSKSIKICTKMHQKNEKQESELYNALKKQKARK